MRRVAVGVVLLLLAFGGAGVARGTGTGSATTGTTTDGKPAAPGPPTLLSANPGSDGIALSWSAPASDGGSPLTGFRIYRAVGNSTLTLLASVGLVDTYTDTTTTAGSSYTYAVSAVNAVGEGPVSNQLSATASGPATGSLFQPYQAIAVGSWPEAVAIGDVSGDHRNDVVLTTSYNFDPIADFRLWVFLQNADGTLAAPVSYATAASYSNRPLSVAVGDITGDGRADVVVGIDGVGVQVFPQLATGGLGSPALFSTPDSNKIRLGDLDGNGLLDVAGVGWGTNTASVLLNDGHGGLAAAVPYPVPHAGYEDLEVADVTGDGRADLVVMSGQSYSVPNVSVLPQLAGGGFGPVSSYVVAANTNTQGIGVGDLTGDGRNDVAASYGGNRPAAAVAVLAQTGSGSLAAPVSYPSYDIPEPIEVADLDLDGRADLVVLHGGWYRLGVYRQQSGGTLGAEELYPIPYASHYNPHGLAVGDVNGDGSPDVVLADYNNGLVVLRNSTPAPPAPTPPSAPQLGPASAGNARIDLAWSAPSSNGGAAVSGYRIYRGTSSGAETLLATVGNLTSYADTAVVNGTTYYYAVSAVNAAGEGPRSNERSATPVTVPGAPTLVVAAAGKDGVGLGWNAPASNGGAAISGYRIYRGAAAGAETLLTTVGNVTAYKDTTAPNGKTSYYQVSAVNAVGEGPRSNELTAKRGR
jgi:fibronectin type 3 domain-containing protein